jgi:hypothetical protein
MSRTLMKSLKNLPATALAILLVACVFAYYSTRDSTAPTNPNPKKKSAASS